MSSNNFINQSDPTAPLNFDNIDIREQYSKLTESERLLVAMKLMGYSHKPPAINQLLEDEYYLGGEKFFNHGTAVFDFWKDALNIIYPNEITTAKPFLVLTVQTVPNTKSFMQMADRMYARIFITTIGKMWILWQAII